MKIDDLWHLEDTELLTALIPEFAFGPEDCYPNPWVLTKARLNLVFPFLREDERQLILEAHMAAEELRITLEQAEIAASSPEDQRQSEKVLASLKEEYAATMIALEPLFQSSRLTEEQDELLRRELLVPGKDLDGIADLPPPKPRLADASA